MTTRNPAPSTVSEPPGNICVVRASHDLTGDDEINAVLGDTQAGLARHMRRIRIDLTGVRVANSKVIACLVLLQQLSSTAGVMLEILPSNTVVTWSRLYHLEWVLSRPRVSVARSSTARA